MTPAEEAVLAAALAYRDAIVAADAARDACGPNDNLGPLHEALNVRDDAQALLLSSARAMGLVDAQPVEAPTVATARPWPDPEAYRALACEVYGEGALPKDIPAAVAAWKALENGARVMCARGYQWTAHRYNGRLMFTMARKDGSPGKTLEQPWYPLITGRLPVWPIVVEAAGN